MRDGSKVRRAPEALWAATSRARGWRVPIFCNPKKVCSPIRGVEAAQDEVRHFVWPSDVRTVGIPTYVDGRNNRKQIFAVDDDETRDEGTSSNQC